MTPYWWSCLIYQSQVHVQCNVLLLRMHFPILYSSTSAIGIALLFWSFLSLYSFFFQEIWSFQGKKAYRTFCRNFWEQGFWIHLNNSLCINIMDEWLHCKILTSRVLHKKETFPSICPIESSFIFVRSLPIYRFTSKFWDFNLLCYVEVEMVFTCYEIKLQFCTIHSEVGFLMVCVDKCYMQWSKRHDKFWHLFEYNLNIWHVHYATHKNEFDI